MSFQNRRRVLLEESELKITTTKWSNQDSWGALGGVVNDGPTLKWVVDNNGVKTTKYGNNPYFTMYGLNPKYVTVTDVIGVKEIGLYDIQITDIDVSEMIYLEHLNLATNRFTSLDISKNTELTFLDVIQNNNLTSQSLDQIIIDLDNHGKLNGNLYYDSGKRSLNSNSAKNSLIGKGWNITEWGSGLGKPK